MAEVAVSKIAEKSANPEVKLRRKDGAGSHHGEYRADSDRHQGGVEMPKTLDTDHKKIHDLLKSMHGTAFDQQYVRVMVEDYDQAAKLFRQKDSSGHDPQLKQFAQKSSRPLTSIRRWPAIYRAGCLEALE
jgi:predicted outer membrane protein